MKPKYALSVRLAVAVALLVGASSLASADHSVARIWNDHLLNAIRQDVPKPPVHARNLFHTSIAMWDAWAAYDLLAQGILVDEKHTATDIEAAREEAISFAVYRVLKYRFPVTPACPHPGSALMQEVFDAQMLAFGYDTNFTSTVGDSPAALGNRIGAAVLAHGLTDGANEGPALCYGDDTGYFPLNPDLVFKLPGTQMSAPNNWQPLAFDFLVLQNGIAVGVAVQAFVGTGWGDVRPFALTPQDQPEDSSPPLDCIPVPGVPRPYFDPGCAPQLAGVGDATLKQAMLEVIRFSGYHDPAQGVMVDASPGALGNNSLGADDGTGHPVNPYSGRPYEPNFVNRGDLVSVIAEFWSDGPQSETPPGHWNVLANELADHLATVKRIGGKDKVVDDLEWDVKVYIALNGAIHDAAIAAWGAKNYYDSSRPISLIRYMAGLGQSSQPSGPSYHPDGLLLEPGIVELITAETTAPGERHHHLHAFCEQGNYWGKPCDVDADCYVRPRAPGLCVSAVGEVALYAWNGPPADPASQNAGAGWIRGKNWMPWFPKTFVTPPFPGYTSGHSTFSRAAAEVLTAITDNEFVPGGLSVEHVLPGELNVENAPSQAFELQWATWFDAADQAGISRRYGGIHPFYDDFPARQMGSQIGQKAWNKALVLYGPTRIDICHKPGSPKPKTINVGKNAVRAHLKHGDLSVPCEIADCPGGHHRRRGSHLCPHRHGRPHVLGR